MPFSDDTKEKIFKLHGVTFCLIKLIILCGVGAVAAWFSNDLFSTCISTFTFSITLVLDSINNFNSCKNLNLSKPLTVNCISLVALLVSCVVAAITFIGIIYSSVINNTLENYQIFATILLVCSAILEVVTECIIVIRKKD